LAHLIARRRDRQAVGHRRWRPTRALAVCAGLAMLGGVLHAAPPTGVVFTTFDGLFHIVSVRVDGSQRRRFAHDKVSGLAAGSPDGAHIAFTARLDGDTAIWMTRPDGGGLRRVFHAPTRDYFPTWSPDGGHIAFTRSKIGVGNDQRVFTATPDGREITDMSDKDLSTGNPAWSPDGASIAYWSLRGMSIVTVADRDARVVVAPPAGSPTWSPDSRELAYGRFDGVSRDIYASKVGGGPARRLTDHPANDGSPEWSRDGQAIVFESTRDGASHIYYMDPDGENVRRLTDGRWDDTGPSWLGGGMLPVSDAGRALLRWGMLKRVERP